MTMDNLSIQVGEIVTIGLGTHAMEVQAWITFPKLGITHEKDPSSSESLTRFREIKGIRHFEKIRLPCISHPKHLKGQIREIRETETGGILALIDLGNRQRWFDLYLLNNTILSLKA
jgi:hypothetical protein